MSQIYEIPFEEIVKKRISVRTYSGQQVTSELRDRINKYMETLTNPFSVKVNFKLIDADSKDQSKKLGTYGVIKGASLYIGATAKKEMFNLAAIGYEFEKLILFATSLGLGTCWLGGTFKRGEFAKTIGVQDDEVFPAISPVGYPADKKSLTDSFVRYLAKGDKRRSWENLFFNGDFSKPLTKEDAGEFAFPLEMVRLAPSASNKQPWRIVKIDNAFHFFEYKTPGYSDAFSYDIQQLDMGIAACHFEQAVKEKNLPGEFEKIYDKIIEVPQDIHYQFSWVMK